MRCAALSFAERHPLHKLVQHRHQRAIAEPVGNLLQVVVDQVGTGDDRAEHVRRIRSVADDALLGFQPLEQLLHRGIVGRRLCRVEQPGDLPNRLRPRVPQRFDDGKLGVGEADILR